MAAENNCANCGAPLAGEATQEFCPKCLFLQASAGICGVPLGDYELLESIGQGGMGVVYRARQKSLDRVVAIKTMSLGPGASPDLLKRFRAEAVAAASLHHPNIVAIHEVGVHERQHFIVMDYVGGQSLAQLAGNQPLPARRAAAWLQTIAEAVHYAHERGILHRDLKPSNVVIDGQDQPHVVDFGLARRLEGDAELTATGYVLGSPNYLAPEQASGTRARVSRRTDVFGLGATLYQLLTGRPPFQAESVAQTLNLVLHAEPAAPRLLNPVVPIDLETICLKCLEKEPSRRYGTAEAMAEELRRFLAGEPIQARPLGPAGRSWRWCRRNPVLACAFGLAAASMVAGLAGIGWQWRRAEDQVLFNRRSTYAADMKEVQRLLDESNPAGGLELLNRYRPPDRGSEIDLRGWEWRYLWSRCQSDERFTLCRYPEEVTALAVSPDSNWLAVRRGNESIAVWDLSTNQRSGEWPAEGPRGSKALAFSPKENLLAWGDADERGRPVARIRDLDAQKEIALLLPPHSGLLVSLSFAPDGKALATLSYAGMVCLWDLVSKRIVTNFPTTPIDILERRLTPAAQVTPSAGPATIGVPARSRFTTGTIYTDHYGCVLFSPNGRLLAIGEAKPRIRLLDRVTHQTRELPVSDPADGISALAFSPDGRRLAAGYGGQDTDIHVWDLEAGAEVPLSGHQRWITGLAFSPDGQMLASASADHSVGLWDLSGKSKPRRFQGNAAEVWAIAWAHQGKDVVTTGSDGSVRFWDPSAEPDTGYAVLPKPIHFWGPSFLPDGKTFLSVTRPEGEVVRWEAASRELVQAYPSLGTNHTSLDLSADGRLLALGDVLGKVQVWDFHAKRLLTNLVAPDDRVFAVWFSPHAQFLACGAFTRQGGFAGRCWETANWSEMKLPNTRSIFEGNFSPTSERLAAFGYPDGTAEWWDLVTGHSQANFETQQPGQTHVAFSPDGRLFAAGALNSGVITLWDRSGRRLRDRIGRGSHSLLHDLIFSPDSGRLIAPLTGSKNVVKFWDVVTRRDVASLPCEPGWFCRMGFSPDGNTLFAASIEGTALLWHAPSLEEIARREKERPWPSRPVR